MSHHISGPRAVAEPIADITDLYAFPSPERPDSLVLVLNTLPFAPPSAQFSDGLIYRFRLRPLTAAGRDDPAPFAAGPEELVFDCVFSEPEGGDGGTALEQEGTCSTPAGETVAFSVNDERGAAGAWSPRLRRRAVGPVHSGCAGGAQDDRDAEAGVY